MGSLRDRAAGSFWVLPAGLTLALGALAGVLNWTDAALRNAGIEFGFAGGPDAARGLLSVIASSTLTLAGLVFSVTLVVLTLASSQYSPRILRSFLTDQQTKLTLGVFLGTYTYALVALRAVRTAAESDGRGAFVPGVTLTVAFVLALLAIAVFALFIDHVVQSIRIERIIGGIAADTRAVIDDVYPADRDDRSASVTATPRTVTAAMVDDPLAGDDRSHQIFAPDPRVVSSIDADTLVSRAHSADALVVLHHGVGRFVPGGAPLLTVVGPDEVDHRTFLAPVGLTVTRTLTQDVAFGLRQLVDIAERALSPGVNDPTTAVQALDQIHDLLRRLATRPIHDGRYADDDGVLRAQIPVWSWDDYVSLALDEVRHWGAGSLQINRRLRLLIDDLLIVVDDGRAEPLRIQRRLLESRAADELPAIERDHLRMPDDGEGTTTDGVRASGAGDGSG
ncbi:MAG: DUF2254 domain-containing protein [Actinobacteria bacterium]|nr:DUF2254 domain-containing protein [Actinomycetota bacterium]